jgi:para-nitrobenzyl esterase
MSRWILILLLAIGTTATSATSQTVKTEGGIISGAASATAGVREYKGVPYAAPPVGELRWKAPAPVVPWEGVRKAEEFAPECTQGGGGTGRALSYGQPPISEDCLYLNVWTPAKSEKDKLPVMVWLHGGAYAGGWSGSPFFNGEHMAAEGVIVITVGYRLGAMGYLALPALTAESDKHASGNYGLLDQIEALRWVQKNISAFGGDPRKVTLFGQSAGAGSVCYVQASPLAKGLFARTIGESNGCFDEDTKLADAEQAGTKYLAAAGASSLADLRAKPATDIAKVRGPYPFHPIVDGYSLPRNAYDIYASGEENKVPLLVGSNSDEATVLGVPPDSAQAFLQQAHRRYGDHTDEFLKFFPAGSDAEAKDSFYLLQTDIFAQQERMWERMLTHSGKPAYVYYFSHKSPIPAGMYPEQARHDLGAFHTAEIVYVFRNFNARPWPWTDEDRKLSDMMSAYWVNFAKKGDPNGPGLPKWPQAGGEKSGDKYLEFGQQGPPQVHDGLDKTTSDFFDSLLAKGQASSGE